MPGSESRCHRFSLSPRDFCQKGKAQEQYCDLHDDKRPFKNAALDRVCTPPYSGSRERSVCCVLEVVVKIRFQPVQPELNIAEVDAKNYLIGA
jgi:hypothetical protein